MQQILRFLLLSLAMTVRSDGLFAQTQQDTPSTQQDSPTRLLRIYEDNDFINMYGRGTDDAYTNGTRIDLFYTKKRPSRFFIDRLMPRAGDSSINLFGWGLMQIMFTPDNLATSDYQPDDYPYSGALFATHTLYSYDPAKKYDFQTDLILGVMGPASLAEQTQKLVHRIINYQQPMGWGNQLGTDILVNVHLTAEKQLAALGSPAGSLKAPIAEVIGGSQVFYGTMLNGLTLYPLVRIGLMNPYFQGYMSQYSSDRSHTTGKRRKIQAYLIFKPEAQLIFSNALVEGALFTDGHTTNGYGGKGTPQQAASAATANGAATENSPAAPSHGGLRHMVYTMNYGAVLAIGHFSISFTQSTTTALMKGLYDHTVGNISMYFTL